ncbi:PREDICTED: NAC domain-containing protein 14 isoform X1 [Theobroma cacao]|uniref:NAC domain-containing protein 14 isoform X1 n=1 Tax=Theobroma cacao TaxID=3641 RepID=A0AB32VWI8_THECC|nr:PREDICTED: NAC domain-containing protein 14 isoform X1 [Theobroma cacao]
MGSISSNSDIVGYRFHPTDKELVDHYLWNKILDRDSLVQAIKEVDGLCRTDPWELPRLSKIKSADQVWYFFSRRKDNKRVKRTTDNGFWKVTGKARDVKGKRGSAIKKTLVFFQGRGPNAKWTPWVMHEYIFTSTVLDNKEGIFLCKLKNKEDEKADTSRSEVCEPSQVADDGIPENSAMFDPDVMLATLEEPDGRDEADNNLSPSPQPMMREEHVPSCMDSAYLYEFSGGHCGVQHLSNSNEQSDDSWIKYLVDSDEVYPDENEGCMSMTCPGECSRKRSRFENGGLCGAIENEECQTTYEQVVSASSMLDEHSGSKKFQAMAMVNAPNETLTSVEHDPHGRERMLSIHNESREMDAPSGDSAVDLHCIFHVALAESVDYSYARFDNPQYQERSQNLIEQEDDPIRITKQGKFSVKTVSLDKARDVKQHVPADNLPQMENAVMESNMKFKKAKETNKKESLQMHWSESAESDERGFFIYLDKPSLNHTPLVYFVNELLGIILFIAVIYELISIAAIGPRS